VCDPLCAAGAHLHPVQRAAEKELAGLVSAALSPSLDLAALPKAVVEAVVVVLEEGGGAPAAAITAASLAAADAGLPAWDLVPACSVVRRGGRLGGHTRHHVSLSGVMGDHRLCQGQHAVVSVQCLALPVGRNLDEDEDREPGACMAQGHPGRTAHA
jgi:hypothetical protein